MDGDGALCLGRAVDEKSPSYRVQDDLPTGPNDTVPVSRPVLGRTPCRTISKSRDGKGRAPSGPRRGMKRLEVVWQRNVCTGITVGALRVHTPGTMAGVSWGGGTVGTEDVQQESVMGGVGT